MPVQMNPAQVDFSQLATLGQNIGSALGQNNFNTAMRGAVGPDGQFDFARAMQVLGQRNPAAAMELQLKTQAAEPDLVKLHRYFGGGAGGSGSYGGGSSVPGAGIPGAVGDMFKSEAEKAAEKATATMGAEQAAETKSKQSAWPSVSAQLERIEKVLDAEEEPGKKRFTKEDFEWGLGSVVGDPSNDFGTRMLQRTTALVEPLMSDSARGVELRDTIQGEVSGLLKIIQPIVRSKGEGSQSDIEFKAIQDLLGSITKSRTPEEYARRVKDIRGRVQNLLRIAETEPDVGGGGQQWTPGQAYVINGRSATYLGNDQWEVAD